MDLARGHVYALKAIQDNCGLAVYNLGTGKGYSVLELVEAFECVNGIKIPYVFDDRRAGDVPVVYSDPSKAERELGWRAEYGINEMVRDSWMIIPALSEPLVRNLRATTPESESH